MKRILFVFLIIVLIVNWLIVPVQAVPTGRQAKEPKINAKSAILIDKTTGLVLWSRNSRQKLPIASTTKIMTAIIVIENADFNKTVKVSKDIENVGQSEIGLIRNEKIKVHELLEAMLVHSANDAAVALAIATAGSIDKFADLMNKKAKEIGAKDSHFSNPDGLSDKDHYSTAYDLAIIGRYAMKNPLFRKIVSLKKTVVNGKERRVFTTRNKLLFRYAPAIGIKTGYTKPAGFCLVSAASKKNRELIAVTLGAPTLNDSFVNAENLLEYGYNNYEYETYSKKNQRIKLLSIPYYDQKLPILAGKTVGFYYRKGSKINSKIALRKEGVFPIKKNSIYGWIVLKKDGKVVSKVPLLAGKDFNTPTFWQKITYTVSHWYLGIKFFFNRLAFE